MTPSSTTATSRSLNSLFTTLPPELRRLIWSHLAWMQEQETADHRGDTLGSYISHNIERLLNDDLVMITRHPLMITCWSSEYLEELLLVRPVLFAPSYFGSSPLGQADNEVAMEDEGAKLTTWTRFLARRNHLNCLRQCGILVRLSAAVVEHWVPGGDVLAVDQDHEVALTLALGSLTNLAQELPPGRVRLDVSYEVPYDGFFLRGAAHHSETHFEPITITLLVGDEKASLRCLDEAWGCLRTEYARRQAREEEHKLIDVESAHEAGMNRDNVLWSAWVNKLVAYHMEVIEIANDIWFSE